ncbi:MAG: HAD family hydrolase [Bacteroidia bacterium]
MNRPSGEGAANILIINNGLTSEKFTQQPKKAIFLDRDGVINRERGEYTWKIEDFEFNPGLAEALRELQSRGYKLIVITNQGGVAKGLYDLEQLQQVHRYMVDALKSEDIHIADVYYCPHHPSVGNCLCRKPNSLMIERALKQHDISTGSSYMIGDKDRDCEAAAGAGVNAILITPNDNLGSYLNLIV